MSSLSDDVDAGPPLPPGWTSRPPVLDDVPELVALRGADKQPFTGSAHMHEPDVEAEVAGLASWTRRQAVVVDPDGRLRGWISVHDRAAGRALVWGYLDRSVQPPGLLDDVAAGCYAWAEAQALWMARLRGVTETRLDESPFAGDDRQVAWLRAAGYEKRRTWLHMTRPVHPDDAEVTLREGVDISPVATHENGMPVAGDLQIVHQMLEESFEDHFNSYRESFPEFVQRLREVPGHRWDHWWLAHVEVDGVRQPAGAVVCSVDPPDEAGREGTYVEYIGVNRNARGRGVAKGLLATVFADALARGRDRVGLEVDADSPTRADALYRSLGFETDYVTDSWFKDVEVPKTG